jgi:iron complex outermembrane receptor protein
MRSFALRGVEVRTDAHGSPFIAIPLQFANGLRATTAGGEALLTYTPQSFWKLTGSYTLFSITARLEDPLSPDRFEGAGTPRHQGQLRASAALPHAIEADASFFAVGSIAEHTIPAWTRLDSRIGWRPQSAIELSVTVQNILNRRHREFGGNTSNVLEFSDIPRTVYGGITWRF